MQDPQPLLQPEDQVSGYIRFPLQPIDNRLPNGPQHRGKEAACRRDIATARIEQHKGRKLIIVNKPDVTQTQIRIGNTGVDIKNPDRFAIQVANTILGSGFTSRLVEEIRVKRSLSYAPDAFINGQGFFTSNVGNVLPRANNPQHSKRAGDIVEALEKEFDVKAGETTADGKLSINIARCLGNCGLAPMVILDHEVHARQTPESIMKYCKDLVEGGQPEEGED